MMGKGEAIGCGKVQYICAVREVQSEERLARGRGQAREMQGELY